MSNPFLSAINYTKLAIRNIEPLSFATYKPETIKSTDNLVDTLSKFQPQWVGKGKGMQLKYDELTNNTLLARYLREQGYEVHTSVYFPSCRIIDLLVNKEAAVECKQNLLSTSVYYSLSSELRRLKDSGFKLYALIYGDARIDFLKDLEKEFGAGNVIVLGDIHYR